MRLSPSYIDFLKQASTEGVRLLLEVGMRENRTVRSAHSTNEDGGSLRARSAGSRNGKTCAWFMVFNSFILVYSCNSTGTHYTLYSTDYLLQMQKGSGKKASEM
jgi:hypothetical protein